MPTDTPSPLSQPIPLNEKEPHKSWPWSKGAVGISFNVLETFLRTNLGQQCVVDKLIYRYGISKRNAPVWCHSERVETVSGLIMLLNGHEDVDVTSKIYLVSDVCSEAVQALGHYLNVTPRFFNFPYMMLSTGSTVSNHFFFSIQLMEKYNTGIIPLEATRTDTPYSARFRIKSTSDGLASHEWHITRIALIFIKDPVANKYRGIIQFDRADQALRDGMKILMTRDEETYAGGMENRAGMGQVFAEVLYIIQYTWEQFLLEAESHLQILVSAKKWFERSCNISDSLLEQQMCARRSVSQRPAQFYTRVAFARTTMGPS